MKIRTEQVIDVDEWDKFVEKTYGRKYQFQQQDGCKDRGSWRFAVPSKDTDDFENDSILEIVNGPERGVSFAAWLARDPKKPIPNRRDDWELDLWWSRNFYPNFQMVANDLYEKGLLEKGHYTINIDW